MLSGAFLVLREPERFGGHIRQITYQDRLISGILVLDHGRLADAGTHAELLERGGLYADLNERQFCLEALALDT